MPSDRLEGPASPQVWLPRSITIEVVFADHRELPRVAAHAVDDQRRGIGPRTIAEHGGVTETAIQRRSFDGETRRQSNLHRRADRVWPRFTVGAHRISERDAHLRANRKRLCAERS